MAMAMYDRKYRKWLAEKKVRPYDKGDAAHNTEQDSMWATSLYGCTYFDFLDGVSFPRIKHLELLAEDLAGGRLDNYSRPPSLNEVASVHAFNFYLDFDCIEPVDDWFVNDLVPALVGVFIEAMERDVDYSGVQVVVTTTLDDSYEMTTYAETKEVCSLCGGDVACMAQRANTLQCRGCTAMWTWTPGRGSKAETVYFEGYGNARGAAQSGAGGAGGAGGARGVREAGTDEAAGGVAGRPATPEWVQRHKSGFHIRFHNATVTLRQAQDLTNAMRQKAMTVHRHVTADQWQTVIDQAPLVRKEGTKTVGLRLPFTCKGQACRTCHGRARVPDVTRAGFDVPCVGCHGAGKVALRGKTYGILNVWYLCTAHKDAEDGRWVVPNLLQLARDMEAAVDCASGALDAEPLAPSPALAGGPAQGSHDPAQHARGGLTRRARTPAQNARALAQGPNGPVQGPNSPVQGPNSPVQGPNGMVQGPNGMVQGPNSPVQGPNGLVQGVNGPVKGAAKRGVDGAVKPTRARLRFTDPCQLWPKVKTRGGSERFSTAMEELDRVRPRTPQQFLYSLTLCSIGIAHPDQQCTVQVKRLTWCPVDNPIRADVHVKKQLARLALTGCNPDNMTLARWNRAQDTRKMQRVEHDKYEILADIVRGTAETYRECVVSGAYWTDKARSCIVCYADGPGSNYCLCLQRPHQSSRAKFVMHAVHGVRIKCSSIKKTNECSSWEGTPWMRLDKAYHALLFGGDMDDSGESACDLTRLVDKYDFLQDNFGGERNVGLLQAYYSRLQGAANVLNSLRRCAYTKKVKVHYAVGFLDYFQKCGQGIECFVAPPAEKVSEDGRRGDHHVLAVVPPRGRVKRAPGPQGAQYLHLRRRLARASLAWELPAAARTGRARAAVTSATAQDEFDDAFDDANFDDADLAGEVDLAGDADQGHALAGDADQGQALAQEQALEQAQEQDREQEWEQDWEHDREQDGEHEHRLGSGGSAHEGGAFDDS